MNGSSTIFWRLGVAVLCLATIGDESPAADIKTAYDHLQRGRYAEASEAALSVEGEVAELAAAMIIHSRALEAQGDYQKALERIETFLKGEPENAPVLTRRAELLLATGKLAEA